MSESCGWFPMKPDEIRAWVAAHRDQLPQTLTELARFPVPFRRVIVAHVATDVRFGWWKEHLESFLGPSSRLTAEQQALVRDAVADLPVILGEDRTDGQARAKALEDRARALITQQQAAEMFGTLGPPEPPGGLPLPADAHPG